MLNCVWQKKVWTNSVWWKLCYFPLPTQRRKIIGEMDTICQSTRLEANCNISTLCEKHFKEDFDKRGKRTTLNWKLNPIQSIQSSAAIYMKRPSSFPIMTELRKPPKIRNIIPDQMDEFIQFDFIKTLPDIDLIKDCSQGIQVKRNASSVLFYRVDFNKETGFPSISTGILIDEHLHVGTIAVYWCANSLTESGSQQVSRASSRIDVRCLEISPHIICCKPCRHTPFFHLRRASSKTAIQAKWSSDILFCF